MSENIDIDQKFHKNGTKNVPKRSYLLLKCNFEKMIIFKNVHNQQNGNKLILKFPKWDKNFTLK